MNLSRLVNNVQGLKPWVRRLDCKQRQIVSEDLLQEAEKRRIKEMDLFSSEKRTEMLLQKAVYDRMNQGAFSSPDLLPFPTELQILGSSILKDFADDNSKCDENGRTLSKQVENTE